jgi:hypothetical protein
MHLFQVRFCKSLIFNKLFGKIIYPGVFKTRQVSQNENLAAFYSQTDAMIMK